MTSRKESREHKVRLAQMVELTDAELDHVSGGDHGSGTATARFHGGETEGSQGQRDQVAPGLGRLTAFSTGNTGF